MSRILLLQPSSPIPSSRDSLPLGLVSIASYLRKHSCKADVVDLGKSRLPDISKYDIVGIGASTPYASNAIRLCNKLKKEYPEVLLILGGKHFAAVPENIPDTADAVVLGEGEKAMLEIVQDGIRDRIIEGKPIRDLDEIPIEDEDLFDVLYRGRESRLHILGSRGCPFKCAFCAEHDRKVRFNSPGYIIEKVELITDRYQDLVFFADDIFTLDGEWAASICEEILRREIKMRFFANGHINFFNRELLELMKRAGLERLSYGIESADNSVLQLIGKGFSVERAEETIARTAEAGIEMGLLYMVGNIGENEEKIKATVEFALAHNTQKWCSFAIPFPGTEFRRKAARYGKILTDDFDLYTNDRINYLPYGVSAAFLRQARKRILDSYLQKYSLRERAVRYLRKRINSEKT